MLYSFFLQLIVCTVLALVIVNSTGDEWPSKANNLKGLCLVSAVSANHFGELCQFIAHMQTTYPCKGLYLYDLGMNPDQITFLEQFRFVKLLHFDMPGNLSYVTQYNAKIFKARLFINFIDAYKVHHDCPVFFYGDTSIRHAVKFDDSILAEAKKLGIVASAPSKHKQIEFTHPGMYDYFNFDREGDYMKSHETGNWLTQVQSGLIMVDATNKTIRNDFMERWAKCCENDHCISDGHHTNLDIRLKVAKTVNGTRVFRVNRDDQSAFTFLIDEYFGRGAQSIRTKFVDNMYVTVSHRKSGEVHVTSVNDKNGKCVNAPDLPPKW